MEMLDRAVKAIKDGKTPNLDQKGRRRDQSSFVENYLPDVHMRLVLYKRIANAKSEEQLREQVEMIDRFGLLPESVKSIQSDTDQLKAMDLE